MPHSSLLPVSLATASYMLLSLLGALYTGNNEFLFYIMVVLAIGAAVVLMHRKVHFSSGVLWGLSLWGLLHMAGGLVPVPQGWPFNGDIPVLYSLWLIPDVLKYDHIVHAYGFGIATWACWQVLRSTTSACLPGFGILTLCALCGMGLGALNELVEFAATLLMPQTNVGGYENTGWDLVSNLVGCVTAVLILARTQPRQAVRSTKGNT